MTESPSDDRRAERLTGFGEQERFGLLLLVLVGLLVLSGVDDAGWVRLTSAGLNVVAFLIAIGRPQNRRQLIALISVGVIGSTGAMLVVRERVDGLAGAIGASAQVVVLTGGVLVVFVRLSRHQQVTTQTLLGAVSAYMLIGFVFAWAYLAMPGYLDQEVIEPARPGEIPLYYSFVVLTTLGFGDIRPVGAMTQRITVLEVLIGQLFLAVLISRLVSVWSLDRARRPFHQRD